MFKKSISMLLFIMLLVSSIPVFAGAGSPSTWANAGIEQMLDLELIPADLQSEYQKPITRGEFARLLMPVLESIVSADWDELYEYSISKDPFSDTDEINVMKAYSFDIIGGIGNNKFNPSGLITREQIAIMMVNAADDIGMLSYITLKPSISDDQDISSWAKAYVYAALDNGLISGTGKGYTPKGNVTREQAIVMVNTLVDNYIKSDSISAYKESLDIKYSKNLVDYKTVMLWKFNGSKPLTLDLMSTIGKDEADMITLFGITEETGYVNFDNIEFATGGKFIKDDGEVFIYDARYQYFAPYDMYIYNTDEKIIGFYISSQPAFKGTVSGFQTSYTYSEALAIPNRIIYEFDDGSRNIEAQVNGYQISIEFDAIDKSSSGITFFLLP